MLGGAVATTYFLHAAMVRLMANDYVFCWGCALSEHMSSVC